MTEMVKFRVVVLFGNSQLFGQERGNIEALSALVERGAADVLFVTHSEWGHEVIQPELARLGLPWTVARYAARFSKGMGVGQWLRNIREVFLGSWQLFKIVRRFRPTHFHVGNSAYFINFLPYLMVSKLPIVYRVGDQPALHNSAYRVLWRYLIASRVSHFVANSEFIKRSLLDIPIPDLKVSRIYSRPSIKLRADSVSNNIRTDSGPIILYAGQISLHKGVDILIMAARNIISKFPEVSFLLAGDFSWQQSLAEKLMIDIQQEGLEKKIIFLGHRLDISSLFEEADLHVCPSVWEEPFPNVVLEAKSHGKASVVFHSGGIPELIRHGVDGYICPEKTSEALASAIEYYLADPSKMIEHGRAAYDSLENVFKMSKFADKWVQVYRETCKE